MLQLGFPAVSRMSLKRRIWTVTAVAIALAWVSGVSADQPEYLLGPQDEVTVTVWGRPELSGKFVIDSEGTVKLPLIDRVKVSGLTVHAMEEALRKSLAEGYLKNPQVTVAVDVYRSQHVFVQGEVRQPGRISVKRDDDLARYSDSRRIDHPRSGQRSAHYQTAFRGADGSEPERPAG